MQAVAEKQISYDLSKFDRRSVVREEVERERAAAKAKKNVRKKSRVSGFSIFSGVIVFGMLIVLLFSYVNLTEASDINRKKREQLESLREEVQMLEVNKNQRMGSMQVREYAINRLGMSKIDKSQITYVSTSGGDRFEVGGEKQETPKLITGLITGLSKIVEYIN